MFDNENPYRLWVTGSLMFGMIVSIWWLAVLFWANRRATRERKLQQRLGVIGAESDDARMLRLWREGEASTMFVPGKSRHVPLKDKIAHLSQQLGWDVPIASVLLGWLGVAALLFLLVLVLLHSLLIAACGVVVLAMISWIYIQQRLNKQRSLFEHQLIDALELIARSLRAGHPLLGAFQLVADELEQPIGAVFMDICQQQSLGISMEEALQQAGDDSASEDMKLFATSVSIQLRTGGNLADMMDRLADIIRQRVRLNRRVRVLTAQTQFSKRILLALPFFVFFILNLLNAEYMELLYTTTPGKAMIVIAIISLCLGAWMMNRMSRLRF